MCNAGILIICDIPLSVLKINHNYKVLYRFSLKEHDHVNTNELRKLYMQYLTTVINLENCSYSISVYV